MNKYCRNANKNVILESHMLLWDLVLIVIMYRYLPLLLSRISRYLSTTLVTNCAIFEIWKKNEKIISYTNVHIFYLLNGNTNNLTPNKSIHEQNLFKCTFIIKVHINAFEKRCVVKIIVKLSYFSIYRKTFGIL